MVQDNLEQVAEVNTKNWIVMPKEFSRLKYNLSISPARIEYNSAVEKAGKTLGLKLSNTSRDSLGREFVGAIDKDNALKLNLLMGNETMSPREMLDYLHLLHEGAKGTIDIYTKVGKKLSSEYLASIRDDIIKVQDPWREEWVDASYKEGKEGLYLMTKHILSKGNLKPTYRELLTEDTLMKDKKISIYSLFKTKTAQGHVSKETREGSFDTYSPYNGTCAYLSVAEEWAKFTFSIGYAVSPDLGVRASKKLG